MTPQVKVALIIAGAILIATALWIYFSPFQSCVRARTQVLEEQGVDIPKRVAVVECASLVGGSQ